MLEIYVQLNLLIIMEKKDIIKPLEDFKGYEEARKVKTDAPVEPISKKEVKAAVNRINPDEHSMERG